MRANGPIRTARSHLPSWIAWSIGLALALTPAAAGAQDSSGGAMEGQDQYWAPRVGVGFTASPETFAMAFDLPFTFYEGISIGPTFRFGVSSDDAMVKPSLTLGYAYRSDDGSGDFYSGLSPHVGFGMGLIYLDKDGPDGTGFLMHFNTGLEYWIDNNVAIGTMMVFDVMPAEVANDHFVYEWQLVTMRVRF